MPPAHALVRARLPDRQEVAVNETEIKVDGGDLYVWAAVDCGTLEVLYMDVSSGQSSLGALLFLKEVLKRCLGRPLVGADCGPWTGHWI